MVRSYPRLTFPGVAFTRRPRHCALDAHSGVSGRAYCWAFPLLSCLTYFNRLLVFLLVQHELLSLSCLPNSCYLSISGPGSTKIRQICDVRRKKHEEQVSVMEGDLLI
ncbi:hypothetical protein R6Z07F_013210 [Ovis aries]